VRIIYAGDSMKIPCIHMFRCFQNLFLKKEIALHTTQSLSLNNTACVKHALGAAYLRFIVFVGRLGHPLRLFTS
jgi:hypothetical protein